METMETHEHNGFSKEAFDQIVLFVARKYGGRQATKILAVDEDYVNEVLNEAELHTATYFIQLGESNHRIADILLREDQLKSPSKLDANLYESTLGFVQELRNRMKPEDPNKQVKEALENITKHAEMLYNEDTWRDVDAIRSEVELIAGLLKL